MHFRWRQTGEVNEVVKKLARGGSVFSLERCDLYKPRRTALDATLANGPAL